MAIRRTTEAQGIYLGGPAGPQGGQGPVGPAGATGAQGSTGAVGPQSWQTPPNAWAALTAYSASAPASTVTFGGESYVCALSHTSTSTFDTTKWTKIAAKGQDGASATAFAAPQGRLTLTSATPVLSSTVSAAASVIYTPSGAGNLIPLWNGTADVMTPFSEVSQALSDATKSPSAAAAANVYDLFGWNDGGTFRVTRGPAWSAGATAGSNTTRGSGAGSTALTRVNGLLRNAVAIANGPAAGYGVYLGTIATDPTGATVTFNPGSAAAGGGAAWIGLWNAHNRAAVEASVRDTTSSWTYASATYRSANNSTNNRATFVLGLADEPVFATYAVRNITPNGVANQTSVALDSTTTANADATGTYAVSGAGTMQSSTVAFYDGYPGAGLHYLQAIEAVEQATSSQWIGNTYQRLTIRARY